ncbi:hypothetical protein Tco_0257159, partial [Tanacetum coccineum]
MPVWCWVQTQSHIGRICKLKTVWNGACSLARGAIYRIEVCTEVCAGAIYPNKVVSEPSYDKQWQKTELFTVQRIYCLIILGGICVSVGSRILRVQLRHSVADLREMEYSSLRSAMILHADVLMTCINLIITLPLETVAS